ncbi:glycosyltransferase [Rubellicoccus peritrichatus]|uniref:Glycosyltransferase n=1 Tax=Rubellicoccus peritrichatus TaxID=3080537 RepID=A0AAQ3QW03_9BACT|nr:glycosyltransferase [Puniceicoccus sp. CR14]WOO41430.1 glycosyltransferase [Puniceicoccus sp. CR14]
MPQSIKVVQVSNDTAFGGGTLVPINLHRELLRQNFESILYVKNNIGGDSKSIIFKIDKPDKINEKFERKYRQFAYPRVLKPYQSTRPEGLEYFSVDWTTYGRSFARQIPKDSIVNLHWVTPGFFDYKYFFHTVSNRRQKTVWTLHDFNPFTGGCHYPFDCDRFKKSCGKCPQLGSNIEDDLSLKVLESKIKSIPQAYICEDLHLVCPSAWIAKQARESKLFKSADIRVIPNGIDLSKYFPLEKSLAKKALGIESNKLSLLFVATSTSNKRKGYHALLDVFKGLDSKTKDRIHFLVIGSGDTSTIDMPNQTNLGSIKSLELMRLAYSAADVFVLPSLQDNLPTTVIEALACGTPTIGFDCGGVSEMITDGVTGYLSETGNVCQMAEQIRHMIENPEKREAMSKHSQKRAIDRYSLERQATSYRSLYEEISK